MSEQSNGPAGPPQAGPPGSASPGPVEGSTTPGPYGPGPYGAAGPTHPMPQWYPATPRRPFAERTMRLWVALVAAAACLVVGLGIGIAVGHATGHDDHMRFQRFPGDGYGFHDGRRFGNRPQFPNGLPGGGQQIPQPQIPQPQTPQPQTPSPSATP